MVLALLVLIPFLACSVWLFFRLAPPVSWRAIRWYNASVIVAGIAVCVGYSLRTYRLMIGSVDSGWWPVIASLGSSVIFATWLLVGWLLRNLVFFRKSGTGHQ